MFETSDLETAPAWPTQAKRAADVTVDTPGLLNSKFAARSCNNDWLDTRNAYTLSRVSEINPNLDGFMRSEAPSQVQSKALTTNYKGSNPLCWMLWPHGFGHSFVIRCSDRRFGGKKDWKLDNDCSRAVVKAVRDRLKEN